MSQVIAVPELIAAAATDVAAVGSSLNAAHLAAAAPTVAIIPAAADEISAGIAQLFSQHAQNYHALAAQAATFNNQFAQHLHAGASSYSTAEMSNAKSLVGAASSTDPLLAMAFQEIKAIQNSLTIVTNQILKLLYQIARFPTALTFLITGATFGGLTSLIILEEFIIFITYGLTVPLVWPFPLGNPVLIPLIPF